VGPYGWNPIETPSGSYDVGGIATGINASDELSGWDSTGAWRCSYSSSPELEYIDTGARATCINNNGVIGVDGYPTHGFICPSGTTLIDLNSSGVITSGLPSGYVINDVEAICNKAIVGQATAPGGYEHGYLLVETS